MNGITANIEQLLAAPPGMQAVYFDPDGGPYFKPVVCLALISVRWPNGGGRQDTVGLICDPYLKPAEGGQWDVPNFLGYQALGQEHDWKEESAGGISRLQRRLKLIDKKKREANEKKIQIEQRTSGYTIKDEEIRSIELHLQELEAEAEEIRSFLAPRFHPKSGDCGIGHA